MMKIKILGVAFLVAVLVAGGGIDSGSNLQFVFGSLVGMLSGVALIYELKNKEV